MASLSSWVRMVGTGWVLMRHDALIPKEISGFLPPVPRFLANVARGLVAKKSRLRPGQRYAEAFQSMGPVFIKLGQVLSTRGDIFGAQFTADLSHLKDQLAPFPQTVAEAAIEEALGKPVSDLFLDFGTVIGSASIAQAHRATLKDGHKVAVKILRPHIEEVVAADIAMLRLSAGVIDALVPMSRRLEPKAFVETVSRSLLLELDLRLEASAADEIGKIINAEPWMSAPQVHWHYVARRVLVTSWVDAMPLSRAEALDLPGIDKLALADNLIRAFLSQALDHGVFHADLHEGNLFVQAPAKLIAIDFGIVGRLKPKERRYLAEMLWGFLRRDYKRVAEVHFEAGYVPAHQDVDSFAQALRAVGEPVLGQAATEVSMGRLLTQLFEITAQFDMHLRPELVLLQKTMVSVEGVARRIYPDHNLWEAARPVVKDWISRELSPIAEARRLFDTLVKRLRSDETPAAPVIDAEQLSRLKSQMNATQAITVVSLIIAAASLVTLVWYVVR